MDEKVLKTPEGKPQTQPREWVTPAFEQIPLKDAFSGGNTDIYPLDAPGYSS